jgi:chondroitin-sulfate-ABC endolyase/exolyase
MRTYLFYFLTLFFLFGLKSSSYGKDVFYEDFQGGSLGNFESISIKGSEKWVYHSHARGRYARVYGDKVNPKEAWLVSPKIDLTGTSATKFSFTYGTNYGTDSSNKLSVLISTDYTGDVTTATWTDITAEASIDTDTDYAWTPTPVMDLSAYDGQKIYIAFKFTSNGTNNATKNWHVDEIKVEATSASVKGPYIGLENSVPSGWSTNKGANLTISDLHYKLGTQSVRWDWTSSAVLEIDNPPNLQTAVNTYKGGLMLWIYNEKPVDDELLFQFGKGDNVEYHFKYGINFKGWRACWIRFKEDMSGPKSSKDLEYMKIIAPAHAEGGKLFFDRMQFPSKRIHDRLTPDQQLPYVNPAMNENHWAALWHWYDTYSHDIPLESSVSIEQQKAFDSIKEKMIESYKGSNPSASKINSAKTKFKAFNIQRNGDVITGNPYVSDDEYDKLYDDVKMNQIGPVLEDLAQIWYHKKDGEAKQMFYDLLDYVMDQGLNVGSGMGTNHHYGYNFREFPPAIFLMKEELKKDGKLDEAVSMLNYWTGIQEYRKEPKVGTLQGLMDSWNTTIVPRLIAIMTMDDTPEKVRELKAIKRWMDISLKIVPGTMGGIKIDGTGFHHGGLYPAYCKGGYAGIGNYLKFVNGTDFSLSAEARNNFGKGLLTMRNYSNLLDWGFGICGRHPLSGSISNGVKNAFAYLAKSGDPDTNNDIWEKMAQAYLRLETGNTTFASEFKSAGISAENNPEGNFTYNYGALGIHRRDNWMVSVKGYNKHVWGSEIYTKDNRYGRYQSYGTVQVIGEGSPVTSSTSGFVEDGWDWNRYPGATSIHLPLDLLESPYSNTLMEKSDEGFAGASNLKGQDGIFGMILKEKNRPNFTGSHQAYKSVFCFDNHVICLGSNISNSNSSHNTETTLFQVNLASQSEAMYVDGNNAVTSFPYQNELNSDKDHWLVDPVGNAYWVRDKMKVKLSRSTQNSRHNKTKAATQGDFAVAWIDHGAAPSKESYEYVILPKSSLQEIQDFSSKMKDENTAAYKILQQNKKGHIVWDRKSNTTGYVFFNEQTDVKDEFVTKIDAPALAMIKADAEKKNLVMSVCDPDLHLPEVAYTSAKPSQESVVIINLSGNWSINGQNAKAKVLSNDGQETRIQFTLKDGIPVEIKLKKKDEVVDNTAPVISELAVSNIAKNAAKGSITANEQGTAYWLVQTSDKPAPDAATVKSSNNFAYSTANTSVTFDISGLSENTSYKVYSMVEDASGNQSGVFVSDEFSTLITGIEEVDKNDVKVYSKKNIIYIHSDIVFPINTPFYIYSIIGTKLYEGQINGGTYHTFSKGNDWPMGIYIVKLVVNNQLITKKVFLK